MNFWHTPVTEQIFFPPLMKDDVLKLTFLIDFTVFVSFVKLLSLSVANSKMVICLVLNLEILSCDIAQVQQCSFFFLIEGENTRWDCDSVGFYRNLDTLCSDFSRDGSSLAVSFEHLVTIWDPDNNVVRKTLSPQLSRKELIRYCSSFQNVLPECVKIKIN